MLGARSVHTSPAACVRARSQDGVGLARSVSRLPDAAAQLVPDLGRERWDSMVRVKYFYAVMENNLLTQLSCPGSVPLLPPLQLSWPGVSSQGGCLVPGPDFHE